MAANPSKSKPLPGRRLRHRVMVEGRFVFGPGKADLLDAILRTGSLAAAARSMGMSYMRGWKLVREMHRLFRSPLVELRRGAKGGAVLTPAGEKALRLYQQMETEALRATQASWGQFRKLLHPAGPKNKRK